MRFATSTACLVVALSLSAVRAGDEAPQREIDLLREMAGCFDVTYRYVEDGEHDSFGPDYQLDDPITEWVSFARREDGAVIQVHVSVTEDDRLVPHFHEIWDYRPDDGQWRHEVWEWTPDHPEREFRYSCHGSWEQYKWSCAAGRAEKPFRDSGAPFGFDRDDYDWLDRTNIVQVTPRGWVHNQHNRKMTDDAELVAYELGWITYEPVDTEQCRDAPDEYPIEPR